ncbi:MAG: DUF5385 family protein [Mycoplasma sp.]|nr:DUF5385 family protein [Candidatus Hennigella equi]
MVGSLMPLILVVIVGIAIYAWYKKRKANREANPFLSSRKNKDEVWKTIKQFLKDNNEQGKEILDSYVCKRDHVDAINPNGSYLYKKNKNYELKIRKWQRKQLNKELKAKGKKELKAPAARDLFVVVFQTRDSKTGIKDAPRCFECEVINTKISKKEYDRKIVINKQLDYDTEMEWIAPVRIAEAAKNAAMEKRLAKQKEQQAKKDKKRLMKKQKKAQKHANKK